MSNKKPIAIDVSTIPYISGKTTEQVANDIFEHYQKTGESLFDSVRITELSSK